MVTILSLFKSILLLQMKIKFMFENNCLLVIFLRLNGIAKIKNAKIKMLRFGAQIAKISNRRKYPLYGNLVVTGHHLNRKKNDKPCYIV